MPLGGATYFYRCVSSLTSSSSKMKAFKVDKILSPISPGESFGRLGSLSLQLPLPEGESPESTVRKDDESRNSEDSTVTYRTPMYLIHTQTGSIPHISQEVFKMIYPTNPSRTDVSSSLPPLQVSVESTLKLTESLEKFQQGIGKFVGYSRHPTFLTIHDPLQALKTGHNDKFGIALWTRHGKAILTPEYFSNIVSKSYKSEFAQIISDSDVKLEVNGIKRLKKSLSRAEEYTSYVLGESSKNLGKSGAKYFITIEAKWFLMDEDLAIKTVAKLLEFQQQVEGIVISGIFERYLKEIKEKTSSKDKVSCHLKDSERLPICEELDLDILTRILTVLPTNLPKYIPGPFKLEHIVDLVGKGIDIFDSSVASRMADYGNAFLLDQMEDSLNLLSKSIPVLPLCDYESLPTRTDQSDVKHAEYNESQQGREKAMLSIRRKQYFDDFEPISKTCTCYTCRKHTRSYIHHLYATDELLGPVLIQIHNLTAMDRFFKILRGVIEDSETPQELQRRLNLVKKFVTIDTKDDGEDTDNSSMKMDIANK